MFSTLEAEVASWSARIRGTTATVKREGKSKLAIGGRLKS